MGKELTLLLKFFRPRGSTLGSVCTKEACNIFSSSRDVGTYVIALDAQRQEAIA